MHGHRSYADILKSAHKAENPPPQPVPPGPPEPRPIQLQHEPQTYNQLQKVSLIGETMTIDHLGHLLKLLRVNREDELQIKYIGGLMVLILFDRSCEAKDFLRKEERQKEHFKWLKWGEETDTHLERVSWIRITSLPLQLWGERNFTTITEGFRRTVAPYEDLPYRVDLSCPKIGILTTRRAKINDEILATIGGKVLKLGVIEFDEDWFPFKFDTSAEYYETENDGDEEEEEEDDNEGVFCNIPLWHIS